MNGKLVLGHSRMSVFVTDKLLRKRMSAFGGKADMMIDRRNVRL